MTRLQSATRRIEFATRAIKEIRAGRVSDGGISKLKGTWKREREIKHLGDGGTQRADLVLHPKYGQVVRKNARSGIINPGVVTRSAKRIKAMQGVLGHDGGFAKVHSIKPNGISYHEYVPGETKVKPKTMQFLRDEYDRAENARDWARVDRVRAAITRASNRELPPTASQKELIDRLNKRGYNVHDLTPRNMIGNKVVDAEVRRKGDPHQRIGPAKDYPHYRVFKGKGKAKAKATKGLDFNKAFQAHEAEVASRVARKLNTAAAVALPVIGGAAAYAYHRHRKHKQDAA
jgi:hypothetical protein